jgi:serine/threonine protein kinase
MKNGGPESKEISDGDPVGLGRVIPLPHSFARPLHPPPQIPDHELLGCIGRGSYGEVWLARTVLGQYRAIKVVYRDAFEHDRPFEREYEGIQKFEPISRSHPSQLAILHVGRNDQAGCFYYVMDLADPVEMKKDECRMKKQRSASSVSSFFILPSALEDYRPKTLKHLLHERGRLPFEECLQIGIALTTALEHLHKHGLVHRDIKPSNIVFVNGVPKLADIGLVTSLDATLSFVGTAGYFPPEGPGTPAADLYSLGKVLYEASMGRDRQEFPKLPADLSESAERERLLELNAVILKACHSDVHQRYQSTKEMHAEIDLLLMGKSVKSKRMLHRQWELAKRVIVAGVLLIVIPVSVVLFWREFRKERPLSSNGQAVKLYNHAVYQLHKQTPESIAAAYTNLNEAIHLDRRFARAYYQLLEVYWSDAGANLPPFTNVMANMYWLAQRINETAPNSAEHHAVKSYLEFRTFHFEEAIREAKRAVELDPNWAKPHCMLAACLMYFRGDVGGAKRELAVAEALDSADMQIQIILGRLEYFQRHFKEAIQKFRSTVSLEKQMAWAHSCLAEAYEADKQYELAMDEWQAAAILLGEDEAKALKRFKELKSILREKGPEGVWRFELDEAKRSSSRDYYTMARNCARLGLVDQMIQYLNKAYEGKAFSMLSLLYDAVWDPWRDNSDFKALLQRVGYPAR